MADVKKVIEIIDKIIADVDEQKLFLTELDNVIGDGDHGIIHSCKHTYIGFLAFYPGIILIL